MYGIEKCAYVLLFPFQISRFQIWLRGLQLFFVLFVCTISHAQTFSSFGTDFYIPFSPHFSGIQANMGVYITANQAATGTVKVGTTILPFTIAAGGVQRFFIGPGATSAAPNTAVYLDQRDGIKTDAAIRVASTSPVTVYAHIIKNFISGASLCLPTQTWGNRYVVPGITGNGGLGQPFINVMAREANTVVEITPRAPVLNNNRTVGQPFRITLANPGDVYQLQFAGGADISGTLIQSVAENADGRCNSVGVFSGSTRTFTGCEQAGAASNFYQQIFPASAWGDMFFVQPLALQQANKVRVYGQKEGTMVDVFNGTTRIDKTIGPQGWVEFDVREALQITATAPVMAVQFMSASSCDSRNPNLCPVTRDCPFPGAPAMVVLNPTTQYLDTISVFSATQQWVTPGESQVNRAFLSIAIADAGVPNFRINGAPPTGSFVAIPGTGYSLLLENVTALAAGNPVHILSSTAPFSCIAHGVGNLESYAYNAGTRLVNPLQQLRAKGTRRPEKDTICRGNPFVLELDIPFRANKIIWLVAGTTLGDTTLHTLPDSVYTSPSGDSLFRYVNPKPRSLTNLGEIPLVALVSPLAGVNCAGLIEVLGFFNHISGPMPAFDAPTQVCAATTQVLKAGSTGASQNTRWAWRANESLIQQGDSASFALMEAGQVVVRMWPNAPQRCPADTAFATINVRPLPDSNITLQGTFCTNTPLQLINRNSGNNLLRTWTINGNIDSTFDSTYLVIPSANQQVQVRLQVRDSRGCQSISNTRFFTPAEKPIVNFVLPGICLSDAFAKFTNRSTFSQGIENVQFLWNFGNTNTIPDSNQSQLANPVHRYRAAGTYRVSLKATAPNGCIDSVSAPFTVNGANPKPAFSVATASPLCSNTALAFVNRSSVDFGNITRLVWYWNWPANPADSTEVLQPRPGDTITHIYRLPPGIAQANYSLRLVAFSGIVCSADTFATLSIAQSPTVGLTLPVASLCSNAPALPLTGGRETQGLSGTGAYRGNGISDNQLLPAQVSGGSTRITYTYTTTQGCTDSATQVVQIVPAPQANAGPDKTIPAGGSTVLEGSLSASATNSSIAWSPPDGLSNANLLRPAASPAFTITYTLSVAQDGCTSTDSMTLTVRQQLVIPNAFSPNSDGINDTWLLGNLNSVPDILVTILDRYGKVVFRSKGYPTPWDGTRQGQPLPAGVYYYIIDNPSTRQKLSGSVALLR